MGAILAFLGAFATRSFVYAVLAKVLVGLGVSVVSYMGINLMMDSAIAEIQSRLSGLPGDMLVIITIARVPEAISVVLSACVARLTLAGLTQGGVLRRIQWARTGPIVLN